MSTDFSNLPTVPTSKVPAPSPPRLFSDGLFRQAIERAGTGVAMLVILRNESQSPIDAHFYYVNSAFCQISGYAAEQLYQLRLTDMVVTDALDSIRDALAQLEQNPTTTIHLDFCCLSKTSHLIWVNGIFSLQNPQDPHTSYLLLSITDITTQQADHQALAEAKKMADLSNRAKSEFLAVMSHEIRTPLNAIVGMVTLLSDTALTPEQRDFVGTIRNSSEALLSIISDILDFSKIESGKLDLESSPFSLFDCIKSAIDLFTPQASMKGIGLSWGSEPDMPSHFQGDEVRLRQVLVNLISNAVKFTDEGEIKLYVSAHPLLSQPTATIKTHLTPSVSPLYELKIAVEDTGIGIAPEHQNSLFESFNQADTSITRRYGGTGLGLAICKRLIEKMGGKITLRSELGKGTCFEVTAILPTIPSISSGESGENSHAQARLEVRWEGEATQSIYLNEEVTTIGRGIANRLVLGDTMVSRCHAQIVMSNDAYWLTDLNSSNGTFLNDKPIVPRKPYPLSHDDSIRIGVFHLIFSYYDVSPEIVDSKKLKILVAEDNRINQQVIIRLLKKIGYEADLVGNGKEAVTRVREDDYNLILMDLEMPEMDGLTATQMINEEWSRNNTGRPYHLRPWIVALTAYATEEDRERCREAGMNGYLTKPIRLPELERTLTQCGLLIFNNSGDQDFRTWVTADMK
jgi:PAS domain S-box-containing protein